MRPVPYALRLAVLVFPLFAASGCAPLVVGGAATGVLMAEDRRTAGTYIMDEEIELKAASRADEAKLTNTHVNFTSYNRRVLMTGETPDAQLKARLTEIVKGVPNVREVINEVAIAAPTSLISRSNDTLLTARVKARLIDDRRLQAHLVKVVSENGVVFLIGIVKRDEAEAAADVASKTGGVTRVVTAFEYIN